MQLTAAVLNAGLGDLTIGLEMAGFRVIAAYETDEKSIAIHEANLDVPVYRLKSDTNYVEEKVDLIAAHVYLPSASKQTRDMELSADLRNLFQIIDFYRPKTFFLLLNASATGNRWAFDRLCGVTDGLYQIVWKKLDVAKMTGFPVKENTVCVVGTSREVEREFQFPDQSTSFVFSADTFLHTNTIHDDWYYELGRRDKVVANDDYPLACWNGRMHQYEGTNVAQWNYLYVPLVSDAGTYRKITHREIANLKGFPHSFFFPIPIGSGFIKS